MEADYIGKLADCCKACTGAVESDNLLAGRLVLYTQVAMGSLCELCNNIKGELAAVLDEFTMLIDVKAV